MLVRIRLIDEMIDATRIQGEVLEIKNEADVNLAEMTRRVIDSYATDGREIALETGAEPLTGNWDETRLEQVLQNLLGNALKYSPSDTLVNLHLVRQGDEAVVSIQDRGLGLGLYIAQQIVTRFRGRIWVESKPGEGSTFFVALPSEKMDGQ